MQKFFFTNIIKFIIYILLFLLSIEIYSQFVPVNIEVDVKSSEEATYSWEGSPEHESYIIKITAADNPENTWLKLYTKDTKYEEKQYRADITYYYKLQGVCGDGAMSEESGERSFTMLPRGQIKNFKCNEGDGTESTGFETIANQKLLERELRVGDTFTYANWCKISVKSVEKVGGYYKGKGVYRIPLSMFGFPLVNIIFDSITLNTDMVALSGGFDAVNRGMKGVADVDEVINSATNIGSGISSIVIGAIEKLNNINNKIQEILKDTALTAEGKNVAYQEQKKELEKEIQNSGLSTDKKTEAIEALKGFPESINSEEFLEEFENGKSNIAIALGDAIQTIEGKSKTAYFLINGQKYEYGETIYLPRYTKSIIRGYKDKDSPFGDTAIWNQKNNTKGSFEYIPEDNIFLFVLSVKEGNDSLKCNVVIPKISFPNMFIDYNNIVQYQTYKPNEKICIVPLKYQSDNIIKFNTKTAKGDDIHKSKKISFSKDNTKSFQIIKDYDPQGSTIHVKPIASNDPRYIPLNNDITNLLKESIIKLRTITYPQDIKRTIQFFIVNEANDPIPIPINNLKENQVIEQLNKIYNPAGISFEMDKVNPIVELKVKYDIHNNRYLGFDEKDEHQIIYNAVHTDKRATADYRIMVVKNAAPQDGTTGGWSNARSSKPIDYQNVMVIYNNAFNDVVYWTQTIAHEIGHAGFGLQHPFKDESLQGYTQGDDPYNFMDYYKGRTSRAYQWDLMFKNDQIKNKRNENVPKKP